jgi:hypothetical protein
MSETDLPDGFEESDAVAEADQFEREAPYGRFANGKARRSPPGSSAAEKRNRTPRGGRSRTVKAPRRTAAKASLPVEPDYQEIAVEGLKLLGGLVSIMAVRAKSDALLADAAAISMHKEGLAKGAAAFAESQPAFAAWMERMMEVGPWAAIVTPFIPFVAQVLTNHKIVPAGTMESVAPEEIIKKFYSGTAATAAKQTCCKCDSTELVGVDQDQQYYCKPHMDETMTAAAEAERETARLADAEAAEAMRDPVAA